MKISVQTKSHFSSFVWGLLVFNILVILWGAWVRISGSGDGCGSHWPTCNGTLIPVSPSLKTLTELSHRWTSALAGLSSIALWLWAFRVFPKKHAVRLGSTLILISIIIEGLLGAGLVLFKYTGTNDSVARALSLPLHLANTFILLGSLLYTALCAKGMIITIKSQGKYMIWATVGLLLSLFTGMSGAVAALGDTLFPTLGTLEGFRQIGLGTAHYLTELRLVHPVLALLASGFLIWFVAHTRSTRPGSQTEIWGKRVLGAIYLQVFAGILNVATKAIWQMQIIHLGLAAMMWLALVGLTASALNPRWSLREALQPFPRKTTYAGD